MASWLSFSLFAVAAVLALAEARPADPVSLMMESYESPVLYLRAKRAPANAYPHRAMMFTGYYRPVRRVNGAQATGVFAQGNAVSGGAYMADTEPGYLQRGPEPSDEPADVSSAEAEAAPNPLAHHVDEEEQNSPAEEEQHEQQEQPAQDEEQQQEPTAYSPEAPAAEEEPAVQTAQRRPAKKQGPKKGKKTPVPVEAEDEDEDAEDEDDSDDEPAVPFVTFKGNRRPSQGQLPNLNNFFPMVFSFPRGSSRGGSSGSPPGMITAIANSYSTAKGGVASSVATAYGGSPQPKKQRRSQPAQE